MSIKFVVIGDLHGQKPNIRYKDFDAIIAPGDFCSDKGIRDHIKPAYEHFLKTGKYIPWWSVCGKRKAKKLTQESLKKGRKILEYLDSFGVPVFIVPGNWDYAYYSKKGKEEWKYYNQDFWKGRLIKGLKNVKDVDNKKITFKGIDIIGYGKSNGPELLKYRANDKINKKELKKNETKYKKLIKKQQKLFDKAKNTIIYLCHNTPYMTPIDTINNKWSPMNGKHFGSNITKDMIKKNQPKLCIAGHMHEHFRACKIGKTTAIDAGFGPEVNVYIQITKNRINKLEFRKKGKIIKKASRH